MRRPIPSAAFEMREASWGAYTRTVVHGSADECITERKR
jgi:hypothetical protein